MAFIAAKCPECGGAIQLDDIKESGFCLYCGTKVYKQVIDARKIVIEGVASIETKLKSAGAFVELQEFSKAYELYKQITDEFAYDSRAWWALAKLQFGCSYFFTRGDAGLIDVISGCKEYKNAIILSDEKYRNLIDDEMHGYINQIKVNVENSDQKIRALLNNDYATINHSINSGNKGFEVINNQLFYWRNFAIQGKRPSIGSYKVTILQRNGRVVLSNSVARIEMYIMSIHNGILQVYSEDLGALDFYIEENAPTVISRNNSKLRLLYSSTKTSKL